MIPDLEMKELRPNRNEMKQLVAGLGHKSKNANTPGDANGVRPQGAGEQEAVCRRPTLTGQSSSQILHSRFPSSK